MVAEENDKITFIPTKRDYKSKSYGHLPEEAVVVSTNASPEEIVAALNEALRKCE